MKVPPVFNGHCQAVEPFLVQIEQQQISNMPLVFDLSDVDFVHPYGVLALVLAARRLVERGAVPPIRLRDLQPQVHHHLKRVDLLSLGVDELDNQPLFQCEKELATSWNRNSQSENLLEITRLHCEAAVQEVERRVSQIFRAHLGDNTGHIIAVVSELCRNAHEHSGDAGFVVVQKTRADPAPDGSPRACLRLAVCDMGMGVRASLSRRHPHLRSATAALDGVFNNQLSASEKGGNGLFSVARRVGSYRGSIWMRSDNAAMECLPLSANTTSAHPANVSLHPHQMSLALPGTQVAVELLFSV